MKTTITGLLLMASAHAFAQQSEFTFPVKGKAGDTWLVIENLFSDIQIEGTSNAAIRIEAGNYRGLPEKAKGLKPLSATGPENTGIGLSITQDGNKISLSGAHREADKADYTLYLPKSLKLKIDYNSTRAGDVLIKGMAGEVEAKSMVGDLKFVDVTGPIVAHTLSSDLEVAFTALSSTSPTSLSSTSGDIDVTMPESVKGTFRMATISGGVYTGHDFDFGEQENVRRIVGQNATGKLNGGGVEVTFKTVSGDIYIRKAD